MGLSFHGAAYKITFTNISSSCSATRSSSTRTGITTSTASAVSAAIARWLMSHLPAKITLCCAMTATAMNFPPSV